MTRVGATASRLHITPPGFVLRSYSANDLPEKVAPVKPRLCMKCHQAPADSGGALCEYCHTRTVSQGPIVHRSQPIGRLKP